MYLCWELLYRPDSCSQLQSKTVPVQPLSLFSWKVIYWYLCAILWKRKKKSSIKSVFIKKLFVDCHNMSSKSLWMPFSFLFLFFFEVVVGRAQTVPCAFKMWLLKSNKADSSGSAKNVSWLQMSKLGCRAVPVDLQFSALQLFSSSTSWGKSNEQVAVEHRCTVAAVTQCINQSQTWVISKAVSNLFSGHFYLCWNVNVTLPHNLPHTVGHCCKPNTL